MKYLVFLAFVGCIAAQSIDPELKANIQAMMTEILMTCGQKEKIGQDDLNKMLAKTLPETQEGKCTIACIHETIGLQGASGISMESALASIDMIKDSAPAVHEAMTNLFTACVPVASTGTERCDIAYKFIACGNDKVHEMGLTEAFF